MTYVDHAYIIVYYCNNLEDRYFEVRAVQTLRNNFD